MQWCLISWVHAFPIEWKTQPLLSFVPFHEYILVVSLIGGCWLPQNITNQCRFPCICNWFAKTPVLLYVPRVNTRGMITWLKENVLQHQIWTWRFILEVTAMESSDWRVSWVFKESWLAPYVTDHHLNPRGPCRGMFPLAWLGRLPLKYDGGGTNLRNGIRALSCALLHSWYTPWQLYYLDNAMPLKETSHWFSGHSTFLRAGRSCWGRLTGWEWWSLNILRKVLKRWSLVFL